VSQSPGPALPDKIAGRYQPVRIIGRGAVADVWEARDENLGGFGEVALKLIHTRLAGDDDTRIRFEREVETLSKIRHPNVVRLLDAGIRRGGMPFLALELLRGRSLLHELARLKRLPIDRARSIAHQILTGLTAAHGAGVIHRDLKPGNVMLVQSEHGGDRAVLVDFGLVALVGAPGVTQQGSVVGSPSYIAPERLRGEGFDERSDLYAVGVMLYEMITGRRPFQGASPDETIIMTLTTHAPYPSEVAPEVGISQELEDVILRAIEKAPAQRAASAAAMAAELAGAA
jgi:eukaryotic-like serine/threonine-protein kinase